MIICNELLHFKSKSAFDFTIRICGDMLAAYFVIIAFGFYLANDAVRAQLPPSTLPTIKTKGPAWDPTKVPITEIPTNTPTNIFRKIVAN